MELFERGVIRERTLAGLRAARSRPHRWQAPCPLEHLQKHGKAQAGDATLVSQENILGLAQRPTVLDVVRLAVQHCLPPLKRPNCSVG